MNTIKIKHGLSNNGSLPIGKLYPYELGYVDDLGQLCVGGPLTENGELGSSLALNYLPISEVYDIESLRVTEFLSIQSESKFPKIQLTSRYSDDSGKVWTGKVNYSMAGENGRAYITEYAPNSEFFERYNFPPPDSALTKNITYTVLTSKGGESSGDFVFNGATSVNGALIVGSGNYGDEDPNTKEIQGTVGQLYFMVVK